MSESNVHLFYTVFRIVNFVLLAPIVTLFTLQMYWDREALRNRVALKNSHRWFRIGGWIGSIVYVVANVDFWSVFGVYPYPLASVLATTTGLSIWIPVIYTSFNACRAASSLLLPESRQRLLWASYIVVVLVGPLNIVTLYVTVITQAPIAGMINATISILGFVAVIFGVNYAYFVLRDHLRRMESKGSMHQASDGNGNSPMLSLSDIVKAWRGHAVLMSIIMVFVTVAYVIRLRDAVVALRAGERFYASDFAYAASGDQPPLWMNILMSTSLVTVLLAILRGDWLSPTNMSKVNGSGNDATTKSPMTRPVRAPPGTNNHTSANLTAPSNYHTKAFRRSSSKTSRGSGSTAPVTGASPSPSTSGRRPADV